MPRVLIFANDITSIIHFRRELLRRLVAVGFEVTIALPAHDRSQALRDLGCEVVETSLSRFGTNPLQELVSVFNLFKIAQHVGPDVIVTFTAKPNIYGGFVSQIVHAPFVGAVTGLGSTFQREGAVRNFMTSLYRLALRRASIVFFENSANRKFFIDRQVVTYANSTVVSGSGVNLKENSLAEARENEGVTRFITVARIRRDKGFDELFAAIRQICAVHDDVEFHLVGWYEDESYREVVGEMENGFPVVVHGSVPQARVRELLSESDCLIHASHHEGMANVILEASATGVPCIVSDIPGCHEAIDDGTSGLLFPVKDAHALASAIERFLSISREGRRSMGLAARQKMETQFDREKVVDQYMAEIRNACAPPE
ncbi:galacturonosyltransferase [Raineyella antarctica]|uniref:Galacturonosyltransferase n=1 Tax=Raineyella antarctica TaxID=1577474 RepID=A0A1G6GEI5_9ACTN|nr:glycosyltransferase family 4 protein [Raineyella antarctica]SDB80387.1 galacturonosyltransferase [Raineyella antarctica]